MKRLHFLLFSLVFSLATFAKQPNVIVFFNQFQQSNGVPFIETCFSLDPYSVALEKNESDQWQGGVQILIMVKNNDEIVAYDKLKLLSPARTDTTQDVNHTITQSRISLAPGNYTLDLEIADISTPDDVQKMSKEIEVKTSADSIDISNIIVLDSYSKATNESELARWGYDLVPVVPLGTYVLSDNTSKLPFIVEIYNSQKLVGDDEPVMVKYFLRNKLTGEIMNDYAGYQRKSASAVIPVITAFNIENLPSGYYEIVVEAVDKTNEMLTTKNVAFYRKNVKADLNNYAVANVGLENAMIKSTTPDDSIIYFLESIYPISTTSERNIAENFIRDLNRENATRFLVSFWSIREPLDYQSAWKDYMKKVEYTQQKYGSSSIEGYKTDMGRVYLQYGKPSLVENRPREMNAYPYQIWQYDQLESASTIRQSNQNFVFVDQTLTGRSYRLIHSSALGEVQDYQWRYQINRQTNRGADVDAASGLAPRDNFGERINNNFIMGGERYRQGDK